MSHHNTMQTPSEQPPSEPWHLDQFLKAQGAVGTGGEAKFMIQEGHVRLNGQVETRRRKKLQPGDVVEFQNQSWKVP